MHSSVQRSLAVVACILAACASTRLAAQAGSAAPSSSPPADVPDEVTVRGSKTVDEYRLEFERRRDEVFRIFNEANQGDDTDVTCTDEQPTGSRMKRAVCRTQAENEANATAARTFLLGLWLGAGGHRTGTAGDRGGTVINSLTGRPSDTGDVADALQAWEAEWRRMLSDNRDLYNAVVSYAEADREYAQARGAEPTPLPDLMLGAPPPLEQESQLVCEASTLTEYQQRNNLALVSGTVSISGCPAGTTGGFTVVARVKNDADETNTLEFNETWQRADAEDHKFETQYPIGDDVFLQSVRVRNLTCTCAAAAQ